MEGKYFIRSTPYLKASTNHRRIFLLLMLQDTPRSHVPRGNTAGTLCVHYYYDTRFGKRLKIVERTTHTLRPQPDWYVPP